MPFKTVAEVISDPGVTNFVPETSTLLVDAFVHLVLDVVCDC